MVIREQHNSTGWSGGVLIVSFCFVFLKPHFKNTWKTFFYYYYYCTRQRLQWVWQLKPVSGTWGRCGALNKICLLVTRKLVLLFKYTAILLSHLSVRWLSAQKSDWHPNGAGGRLATQKCHDAFLRGDVHIRQEHPTGFGCMQERLALR